MAVNANTQVYDKVIDRAAMVRLFERRMANQVELEIDGHVVRLDELLSKGNLSVKGQRELFKAIDEELTKTYRGIYRVSKKSLLDLASDQMSYAYQNVESTIGKIWRPERPPKRVAEEFVLEKPLYDNKTLDAGWAGVSMSERKRLEIVIRRGIANNKTIDEIALEVRKGNVHTITRNQAKALVVTSVTSVTTQADHAVYRANEKALAGWQYVAVLDRRTTPVCVHRDGNVYPIGDTAHLPPAHFRCRSTTVPVFKSWSDIANLEGAAQVRRDNIRNLTAKQRAFYDGNTPLRESYDEWLRRQPQDVQLRHLGDYRKVAMFQNGSLTVDQFTNPEGNTLGIRELRALTDSQYTAPNDTKKFAIAKQKLDAMQLWATTPDDFINNKDLAKTLADYYRLQATELDGTLSLVNYRGLLIGTKKAAKRRVLTSPPTEEQLVFNPVTGRYEDIRVYQPNVTILNNNLRLVNESDKLLDRDKEFITKFVNDLEPYLGANERAVIADNLRITFGRQRENKEVWGNYKAVNQAQIKFDVMNVSDAIETQLRKDTDLLKRLAQDNYIDPVLGSVQLQDLHDNFIANISKKNRWEDSTAPKIARELRSLLDITLAKKNPLIWKRLSDTQIEQFYLRFAHRLSLADTPDRDQLAVALGRDLYNAANLNGNRTKWFNLGLSILEQPNVDKLYKIETFGVQKRRMKSRLSGSYFGPYYDTLAYNIRVVDPRIQEYARLTRKVDIGLRVAVTRPENKLIFRKGYKTYFVKTKTGLEDTRIPITSTNSFGDFPTEFVDDKLVDALTWASQTQYKIDEDYFDFIMKLLRFEDDKGKAKYYSDLNEYRHYIASRGDAYERFKSMEWLRGKNAAFSNHAFVDHRARIYDRGLISPQSGETFRPFLNTAEAKLFSPEEFDDLQDQIGAFLGGLSDKLEGNYNSLTITGRQKIAAKWRDELVKIGNHMIRAKPGDIRAILESDLVAAVEGEELGKFFRFAIEMAKIDKHLELAATKVYQEIGQSYMDTVDGRFIDINRLFIVSRELPTRRVSFDQVEGHTYKLTSDDERRIANADLSIPILVERDNRTGRFIILDGNHRYLRAKRDGIDSLNIKVVSRPVLERAIVNRKEDLLTPESNYTTGKAIERYSEENLRSLRDYKIALALEQDASSSGAQIIALTTRNKQLAELSNVVPTTQKRRLYDEIAASTYNDPRFRELNAKLGLTEKDLRKAAKA